MKYTRKNGRASSFISENTQLFEDVSRAVLIELDYASVVEESLSGASMTHLLLEELSKEKLQELEDKADEARADIEEFIAELTQLGMDETVEYLNGLKDDLPGTFGLVKMAMFGDAEEAAKKIGEVTSIATKLQLAKDSVASAIELVGSELGKLPFNDEAAWKKFSDEKADEDGNIEVDGEKVSVDDLVTAMKEESVGDILDRAAEMQEMLADFKFPSSDDVFNAAKNQYQPPEKDEPSGLWGKLMDAFAKGDLTGDQFATDIMSAKMSELITKADEMAKEAAEAEQEADQAKEDMADIEDEVQALGQGDSSVLPGAQGAPAGASDVNVQGVGTVPLTPQLLRLVFPGAQQTKPEDVAKAKAAEIPELQRTVTSKLGLPDEFSKQLAALINDDPKSPVFFADPEEAEKAQDDQAPTTEWVHHMGLSSLLNEDLFYKDVANLLKAVVGTVDDLETDEDIPPFASDLGKRLANQYDIKIQDLPGEEKDEAKADDEDADKDKDGDKASLGDKIAEHSTNIANEFTSPETAAAALGALGADDSDSAASLWLDLSPPMKGTSLAALAKMKGASGKDLAQAIGKVGDLPEEEVAKISEMQVSFDGMQLASDILRTLGKEDFENAVDGIAAADADLGQKLFDASVRFEDIRTLQSKEVQMLMREIEPMKFAIALKPRGVDDELTQYLLSNMSSRDAEVFVDDMEKVDGDSKGAEQDIVDMMLKLGEEGNLDLKRTLKEGADRRRAAVLSARPYYKKGMLSEVLLGAQPVLPSRSVDTSYEASRMLRLAGLEEE